MAASVCIFTRLAPRHSGRVLIWLTKCQEGGVIVLPIFHGSFFLLLRNELLSWQRQQSTTVDPADMREFIPSGDGTYRPDHGASRGASSLQARGSDKRPLNDNEGSPKPSCSLPTHQFTAKLSLKCFGFLVLAQDKLRASAADAKREPARQRWDCRTGIIVDWLWGLHPLSFLRVIWFWSFFCWG